MQDGEQWEKLLCLHVLTNLRVTTDDKTPIWYKCQLHMTSLRLRGVGPHPKQNVSLLHKQNEALFTVHIETATSHKSGHLNPFCLGASRACPQPAPAQATCLLP
eukprot:2153334-Amphidinium_carterae.1